MRAREFIQEEPVPRSLAIAQGVAKDLSASVLRTLVIENLPKILQSAGLKSIPGIGIIAGLYYAGRSLQSGDWIDAGLNLAGGFTSLAGSIALSAYQAARSLYQEAYHLMFEQDLAQDPTGAQRRITSLTSVIKDELSAYINKAVKDSQARVKAQMTGSRLTQATMATQPVKENFADGRNPGRRGLSKRMGVNTHASVSSLRATARHSSGEKARMAHWLANMKAGRARHDKE